MQDSRFFYKEPAIFFMNQIIADKTIDDHRKFSTNKGTC